MFESAENDNMKNIRSSARIDGRDIFSVMVNYGTRGLYLSVDVFDPKTFAENKAEAQSFISSFIARINDELKKDNQILIQP